MTNDRFRKQLEIDLTDAKGEPIFETMDELKILMRRLGYRRSYSKKVKTLINLEPTQKQLDVAYFHLTKKSQRILEDFFRIEKYEKHEIKRATRNIYRNGKLYKKGQFLPKE